MGRAFGFISLVIVVAIGGYLYTRQAQSVTSAGTTPQTTIDVVAVQNDLLVIAKAERHYWATNSRYASLDELQKDGDIEVPRRQEYSYSAEAGETGFSITASYSGADPKAPRHIRIDETMTMTTE